MSKYAERKEQTLDFFRALRLMDFFKSDKQFVYDVNLTLQKSIYESVALVCEHQLKRIDITSELKKYFIGKMYRAKIMLNKQNHCNYSFPEWCNSNSKQPDSYQSSRDILNNIGNKYEVSGSSVCKYDSYSRAIDKLTGMNSISVSDILYGKIKIPIENIVMLSRMSDKDIEYLKILFCENFYKLSGYIFISNEKDENISPPQTINTAQIKNMPEHDPDSMFSSLTYTIPSWVNFIKRTMLESDMTATTFSAKMNLYKQLNYLREIIDLFLVKLEEKNNE